jgi:hypothetical protein
MAVLTILMTGAARRQAVDPAPPATMTKRPCRARIRLPAERGIGFVALGDRHWSGTGERSAAVLRGATGRVACVGKDAEGNIRCGGPDG